MPGPTIRNAPWSRLFIYGVPPEIERTEVHAFFAGFGELIKLYFNGAKRYGYVRYQTVEQAAAALAEYKRRGGLFGGAKLVYKQRISRAIPKAVKLEKKEEEAKVTPKTKREAQAREKPEGGVRVKSEGDINVKIEVKEKPETMTRAAGPHKVPEIVEIDLDEADAYEEEDDRWAPELESDEEDGPDPNPNLSNHKANPEPNANPNPDPNPNPEPKRRAAGARGGRKKRRRGPVPG